VRSDSVLEILKKEKKHIFCVGGKVTKRPYGVDYIYFHILFVSLE